MDLLTQLSITKAIAYTAAGTTTLTGTVDMQSFGGCIFVGEIVTQASGNYMKAGQGDASNGSDAVDLAGSKIVTGANGNLAILDICRPAKGTVGPRYLTVSIVRGTSTVLGGVYAIRYGAHKKPITNTVANAADAKTLITPAEGTA